MSEQRVLDPRHGAVYAAHEMVIELVKSGVLEMKTNPGTGTRQGETAAESVIAAHKKLVEYYETLS